MADFYDGSALRIKIGTKEIYHEIDCKVSLKSEMKELGSKDVSGTLVRPGKQSFSISGTAIAINSDGTKEDLNSLAAAWKAKTELAISVADGVSGNIIVSGNAYIESIDIPATDEEIVKYDISFVGNGDVTIGTTT